MLPAQSPQTPRHSGVISWRQALVQSFVRDSLPAHISKPFAPQKLLLANAKSGPSPGTGPTPCARLALSMPARCPTAQPALMLPTLSAIPFRSAASHFSLRHCN